MDLTNFFTRTFFGETRNTKPRHTSTTTTTQRALNNHFSPLLFLFSGIEVYTRALLWHWGNVLHHALATTIRALRGRLPPWQWVANEDYQIQWQSRRQVNCWEQVVVVVVAAY